MSSSVIPTSVLQEVMDAMDDMATDSRLLDMKQSRIHQFDAARDALRAALERPQGQQEPVANLHIEGGCMAIAAVILPDGKYDLYTSMPAKREPLTNDQVLDMAEGCTAQYHDLLEFARAIEAAHDIK